MEFSRYTQVPPISTSASETDCSKDTELHGEMEKWKQKMKILKDKENYEDRVIIRLCIFYYLALCMPSDMVVFGDGPSIAANRIFPRPTPVAMATKFRTKLDGRPL